MSIFVSTVNSFESQVGVDTMLFYTMQMCSLLRTIWTVIRMFMSHAGIIK